MPVQPILWRKIDSSGLEYCQVQAYYGGWQIEGTALFTVAAAAAQVRYSVVCDNFWRTRKVEVHAKIGLNEQQLQLTVDQRQRWWLAGRELEPVRGCSDVDLGFSPATNTLPIRRLRLAVGQKSNLTAAWVRFPELEIEPLPQQYTRLAENRYKYESGNGRFETEIEVDQHGLITHYPNGWQRVTSDNLTIGI